jgi:hypothetical protein
MKKLKSIAMLIFAAAAIASTRAPSNPLWAKTFVPARRMRSRVSMDWRDCCADDGFIKFLANPILVRFKNQTELIKTWFNSVHGFLLLYMNHKYNELK